MVAAEALDHEMRRLRSAAAPSIKEMIARGIVKEFTLPIKVDHSSHVRYVRHQGAYACGMNAQAAVWDILNDMYCPPNFHPNVSANRAIWAWRIRLTCEPADKPCGERTPGKIGGLGTPAAAGTALTSTTLGSDPRIYFLTSDTNGSWVAELAFSGGDWVFRWVSHDVKGPSAAAGTVLASTTLGGNPRVYYLGGDHHVHELAWLDDHWNHSDASVAASGAVPAASGSALTATTLGGNPRVYYQADDHCVHELAWLDDHWNPKAASHAAGLYTRDDDLLYYEGCATEGSELTNSDAVQWPTDEGDYERTNFRLDRHVLAKPGEYTMAIPVTVEDLRYWLAGGPLRITIMDGHHSVALVGYDDTTKRFKFLNSWGDQWSDKYGDKGFGYIEYSNVKSDIQGAEAYTFVPPKAMPCLRVKFTHSWRQDVYLWIGVEGATKCKRIWPTGQRQDDSHNLWLTVTLPQGFAWPPTQQNRVYLDVYDCGAHSNAGGLIEELITGYNGNYVTSSDLATGPVPFQPGKMTRLTVP